MYATIGLARGNHLTRKGPGLAVPTVQGAKHAPPIWTNPLALEKTKRFTYDEVHVCAMHVCMLMHICIVTTSMGTKYILGGHS